MVFNIALAIPAFLGLKRATGATRWLITLAVLSLFAFAIESIAVATGVPYGRFSYGADLGPKLLGLVPMTLPFSWIPIVLGSRVWAAAILGPARVLPTLLLSAGLMVAFDLVLDPGAAALRYWTWESAGAYYGIPESNFVGWVISSLIAQVLLTLLTRSAALPWFTTYSLAWGLFFWTCVAALSGWLGLTLWALLLLAGWLLTHQKKMTAGLAGR